MKLRIMTYNICSGHHYEKEEGYTPCPSQTGPYDISRCTKVIAGLSPDICGLNEVDSFMQRTGEISQTDYIAQNTGMTGVFGKAISFSFDPSGAYGNAVLSKYPIVESEVYMIPDPEIYDEDAWYETRSITRVVIDVEGVKVTVLQTHFGLSVSEKQNAVTTLVPIIDSIKTPLILMGDFNIRPNDFLLNPIRERLFDTAQLKDGYFKTFPSYECKYPECKIDYVFMSKHFKPLNLEIFQTCASDHLPYVVEAELNV